VSYAGSAACAGLGALDAAWAAVGEAAETSEAAEQRVVRVEISAVDTPLHSNPAAPAETSPVPERGLDLSNLGLVAFAAVAQLLLCMDLPDPAASLVAMAFLEPWGFVRPSYPAAFLEPWEFAHPSYPVAWAFLEPWGYCPLSYPAAYPPERPY
jgi:hypothetical protein